MIADELLAPPQSVVGARTRLEPAMLLYRDTSYPRVIMAMESLCLCPAMAIGFG